MSDDWHPEQVKAAIRMGGLPLDELSRRNGYHRSACRRALKFAWPAVEKIIADALGLTPQAIWPSRYDAKGKPLTRRNSRSARRRRHRQN